MLPSEAQQKAKPIFYRRVLVVADLHHLWYLPLVLVRVPLRKDYLTAQEYLAAVVGSPKPIDWVSKIDRLETRPRQKTTVLTTATLQW